MWILVVSLCLWRQQVAFWISADPGRNTRIVLPGCAIHVMISVRIRHIVPFVQSSTCLTRLHPPLRQRLPQHEDRLHNMRLRADSDCVLALTWHTSLKILQEQGHVHSGRHDHDHEGLFFCMRRRNNQNSGCVSMPCSWASSIITTLNRSPSVCQSCCRKHPCVK